MSDEATETLRFDGKVAVITGAGRGLGRAYALLLASRGAAVVVNDVGADLDGRGRDGGPADEVVDTIRTRGGQAVASRSSVADGPQEVVDTALREFGQLDVLVNNAGFNALRRFDADAVDLIRRHLEVHFFGTIRVTAAAWQHLGASGHGRVVNTISPTLSGRPEQTPYISAKGAVLGFTKALAVDGRSAGIRVNAIAPTAGTRMVDTASVPEKTKQMWREDFTTDVPARVVAYLAHTSCAVTGESIVAGGDDVRRIAIGTSDAAVARVGSVEAVVEGIEGLFASDALAAYPRIPIDGQ